jgi:hypothetical protein
MPKKASFLKLAVDARRTGQTFLLRGCQLTLADIRYHRSLFVMETGQ